MANILFLEVYSTKEDHEKSSTVKLSLVSYMTYCLYKFCCSPEEVMLKMVVVNETNKDSLILHCEDILDFEDEKKVPYQVSFCIYPVVLFIDTVITGLCAVARHISKFKSSIPSPQEHEEGLLGFRKSCLQAPNEVSIWTKFCEVDLIKTATELLQLNVLKEIPENLVRFENHLSKPVRIHNVYKVARDIKKENITTSKNHNVNEKTLKQSEDASKTRVPKTRKWKSKVQKQLEIDCSILIQDVDVNHQFAEGPFLILADLVLLPLYNIFVTVLGKSTFETLLPLSYKWYKNMKNIAELQNLFSIMDGLTTKSVLLENVKIPQIEDVSLYKCDPKRHNPKKRLFTKEDDIENALSALLEGMELEVSSNDLRERIDWDKIPAGANPAAGHLPDDRMIRKSQQLENLTVSVLKIAKEGNVIVDFCCGSGHLGILLAYLLPKCTIILLENKEQSLLRARKRVHEMGLTNVFFFQCNLDFFIGKFDIGIALHACGIASDLVLDKCLKAKAKFILSPCCYGSLHSTDRLVYPRSKVFKRLSITQYLCIGHAADQTHEEHPLTVRGGRCMAVIDSDRARLAEEYGYKVSLSRLEPLSCTPKNNILVGIPLK